MGEKVAVVTGAVQQGQGDVGRRDIVLRLEDIADASLREDGTDIPLGEQLREAAREITRLRTLLSSSRGEQGKAHTAREVLTYLYSESKWEEDVDGDIGGPIVNHNVRIRDSLLDELLDMADIPRGRYDETPLKRLVRANEEDQNDTSPSAHGSVQTSAAQGWREALVTASMALTAHNDWQLKRTDPEVLDGVEYIPAEAYAESTLYELTDDALSRIKACEAGSVPTSLAGQVPDDVLSTIGDWAKWAREWSGSAFIAGDPVEDEAEHRDDLYAGLCRLGNEMLWLGDEVLKLSAAPRRPE